MGSAVFEVAGVPPAAEGIFGGRHFCSPRCVRVFCLESLEALDALDTVSSRKVVSDLHELYAGLAAAFATLAVPA